VRFAGRAVRLLSFHPHVSPAGYPSGQRGLTVNQLASPSGVRIPHPPRVAAPPTRAGPLSFPPHLALSAPDVSRRRRRPAPPTTAPRPTTVSRPTGAPSATDLGPPDLGPVARGVRHATVVSRGKDAPGGVRTDPRGVVCGLDAGGVPGGRCAMSRFQAKFPSDRMAGRVALVTGGARGMGASTVRRLVAEGAQVVITDVLDAEGEALAAELGENAVYAHLDVTDEAG